MTTAVAPVPVKASLFGLEVDACTMAEVVELAERRVSSREGLVIGVVNAAKVVKLSVDRVLRESLLTCDLLLADGQAVVWASRLLGPGLPERVAGIDLFQELLGLADRRQLRVYLLGARPEVLTRVADTIARKWPGVVVAGSQDGYFSDDQAPRVAAEIAASGADMLFLGMTTPKKEIFLGTYGERLGVPVQHGVGGSFDILAGVTRRAPTAWQRLGMEWAYRVVQEPRRLWRRYLVTNSAFLLLVMRERIHARPSYRTAQGGTPHA